MNTPRSHAVTASIALVALAFSAVSYLQPSSRQASLVGGDSLTKIQKTGRIDVCYAVWPPAEMKDPSTGRVTGHDVEAIEYIAAQIGAKVVYHEQTFATKASAVQSGTCDVAIEFFVKIGRSAAVAFTNPLYYVGNSALVRRGDEARFKTVRDIDRPGVRVAVATGESGHIYAKEHFKHATIISIDVEAADLSRFLLEVTSGRADVGLADASTIRLFAAAHPDTVDLFANTPFDLNPVGFAVRHGDTELLTFLNNSLLYMQTSGVYDELLKKYEAQWLREDKRYIAR